VNIGRAIIGVVATQRLTQLITEDEIARPIREKVNNWAGDAPEFSAKERLAYMVECPACTSIWAGGLVAVLSTFRLGRILNGVLALSGAALAVDATINRITPEN
jgi:hypothetical protein